MMRKVWFLFALAVLAACFPGCEGGGNSGSETTNGLTGTVKDLEGRPVPGARVVLLPEAYNPAEPEAGDGPRGTRTDAKGVYALKDLAPGRYHLEMSDPEHGLLTLIQDVSVTSAGGMATLDGTLGRPGSLRVRIADFVGAGESGYVYIPGTTAMAEVDSAARAGSDIVLASVPVGRFPKLLLVVDAGADRRIVTLARDFEVLSESTVISAPFQTWTVSRKIAVNTAAMGVAETVADFPLLVRLNAANFDFAQAQANGQDLRFTAMDGKALRFQIERWSAEAKRAEIWVRLDSVAGDSPEQFITMHWGRTSTVPALPGAVFDASAGFAAVYHLNDAATADADGYKDATPNGNHATAAGINAGAKAPGISAGAKAFAGKPLSDLGTLKAAMPTGFRGNTSFTVSFWMRYDTTATRQCLFDFGNYATLRDVHFLIRPDSTLQFGPYDGEKASGKDPATWQNVVKIDRAGQWVYATTVYDAEKATVTTYVDGVRADVVPTPALDLPGDGALRIGKALGTHPTDHPFNGTLDEIRFSTRALSADPIRLDYLTQKP